MANMVNMTNSEDGKQMVSDSRTRRFVVMLTPSEEDAIQKFRYDNRLPTKSEAARELIKAGLAGEMKTASD
ncbi:hypothetical protein [Rhizobium sp. Root651]|uniref:hypothetical protein n=1 Tax=Rhizobium sp. Root651 TaxID=1736577 RepID=UPI000714E2E7|nr:hypothetical protein [Rhizobium sp. Root651]KRA59001.1 hypothetical protein ASD85_15035 [Rhizobium sp. Root651]